MTAVTVSVFLLLPYLSSSTFKAFPFPNVYNFIYILTVPASREILACRVIGKVR